MKTHRVTLALLAAALLATDQLDVLELVHQGTFSH